MVVGLGELCFSQEVGLLRFEALHAGLSKEIACLHDGVQQYQPQMIRCFQGQLFHLPMKKAAEHTGQTDK